MHAGICCRHTCAHMCRPARLQDRIVLQQQARQAKRVQPGLYPGMAVHKHARAHMCATAQAVPSQPATAATLAGHVYKKRHVYRHQEGTRICNIQPSCQLTRHLNINCSQDRRQAGTSALVANAKCRQRKGTSHSQGTRRMAQVNVHNQNLKPTTKHAAVGPAAALRYRCFVLMHSGSRTLRLPTAPARQPP
jgi:hypothetical protein